jgi:hypothetical protein
MWALCAILVLVDAAGSDRGLGQVFIHEPLHYVDPMREQVRDLAAAEIE